MIGRLVSLAVIGGAILSMVLLPDTAWAEKRVAMIVGNSTYLTVPQLPNPSRDASAVAKMLKDAGYRQQTHSGRKCYPCLRYEKPMSPERTPQTFGRGSWIRTNDLQYPKLKMAISPSILKLPHVA